MREWTLRKHGVEKPLSECSQADLTLLLASMDGEPENVQSAKEAIRIEFLIRERGLR